MADSDAINYRGDKLGSGDLDFLYKKYTGGSNLDLGNLMSGSKPGKYGDPVVAGQMFANWLYGFKPVFDPIASLARSAAGAAVQEKAGAGLGMAGLFGLGKILGGPPPLTTTTTNAPGSPMASGVPYSVAPMPNIFKASGVR